MPSESGRGDVRMAAEELDQDFEVQVLAGYQEGEGGAEMIMVSQMWGLLPAESVSCRRPLLPCGMGASLSQMVYY